MATSYIKIALSRLSCRISELHCSRLLSFAFKYVPHNLQAGMFASQQIRSK